MHFSCSSINKFRTFRTMQFKKSVITGKGCKKKKKRNFSKTHKHIWNFSQHNVCPKTILLWPTKIVTLSDMSFPKRKTMVCCFIPHLTGLKFQQASLKYFSLIKAMCQTTSSDTTAWEMTFYINFKCWK